MKLLFLLLIAVYFTITQGFVVNMTLSLNCWTSEVWCYEVEVWERDDYANPDDFWIKKSLTCNQHPGIILSFKKYPIHDGPFDGNYETSYYITHNCTTSGDWYCYYTEMDIPVWNDQYVTVPMPENLMDLGTNETCDTDPNWFKEEKPSRFPMKQQ